MAEGSIGLYFFILVSLIGIGYVPRFEAEGDFSLMAATIKIIPILYLVLYANSHLNSANELSPKDKTKKQDKIRERRRHLLSGVRNGLLYSAVGDIILLLRRRNDYCFLLGTLAFGFAQVSYMKGMGFDPIRKGLGVALYGVAGAIATYLLTGAPLLLQVFLPAYGALLTTSLWRSCDRSLLDDGRSEDQKRNLILGFGFFLASDLWIGVSTFLITSYPVLSATFVLATYYIAQGFIAFSAS